MATDAEKGPESMESNNEVKQSFLSKVKDAKESSDNNFQLCCVVCGLAVGTIACKIVSLIFSLIPIFMIYFGAKNLHNCTVSPFIPIFLLVLGCAMLLDNILLIGNCRTKKDNESNEKKTIVGRILDSFITVWFVVGSVYIYKVYEPNYDPFKGEFCDKTTYLFGFWIVTLMYAFILLFVVVVICTCFIICGMSAIDTTPSVPEEANDGNRRNV